jgi:cyclophilin family peptidyl-prolyl cis-trans isomerase
MMMMFRRSMLLAAALTCCAMPALAQDLPELPTAPAPAPAPTPAPAPAAPAALPAVTGAPVVPIETAIGNPEYQLALDLSTGGRVIIQLRPDKAPNHVERVRTLARQGFYDGLVFHRVIDGFMAQGGDPLGNGSGGSPLPNVAAEFNDLPHVRGVISMARSESPDSANSQFFLMLLPRLSLDQHYTGFGRVISGMQFVDAIARGEPPANPTRILQASMVADNRPLPNFAAATPAAPTAAPITADDLNAPIRNN